MTDLLFYLFLAMHLVSLIVAMGAVIVVDVFGLLWFFKKTDLRFTLRVADTTQQLIWIGWAGLVISGVGLLTMKGFVDNLTLIKIFFVALVGANGIFLHTIKRSFATVRDESKIPSLFMYRIVLATAISQTGWWGAIAIGFLHRSWRHMIDWPEAPELVMCGVLLVILSLALFGERFFRIPERRR